MLKMIVSVVLIAIFSMVASSSAQLPSKATYVFYIQGEYAGKCAIEMGTDGDRLVFDSATQIDYEDYTLDLTSRTEVEKESLALCFYKYEGVRMGQKISGTVWADGDSLSADNAVNGEHFPSGKRLEGAVYLFDNYVSEHQIIMAWAADRSKEPFLRFTALIPSEFMMLPTMATTESEIELQTSPKPTVCKKFGVAMKNSGAYFTYYDSKRKIPVYMDFPAATTEVFLEGTFKEKPQTKYVRPEKPE